MTHGINARTGWGIIAALVVAGFGGAIGWNVVRAPPVQYTTTPVAKGSITRIVTATGTVNPLLTIIIGTYVSGIIQSLYCDYNTGPSLANSLQIPAMVTLDKAQTATAAPTP